MEPFHRRLLVFLALPLSFLTSACLACALAACGDGEKDCDQMIVDPSADGLFVGDACGRASVRLLPRVLIGGLWRGGGEDGPCTAEADRVTCPAGAKGQVAGVVSDGKFFAVFHADEAVVVEALSLEGPAELEGARAWLSNGFQSWSQSGVLAIGPSPTAEDLDDALKARGDPEVHRNGGDELSWWYTFAGGGEMSLVAGALTSERLKPWAQVVRDEDDTLRVVLASGGAGERIAVDAGDELGGETWMVALGHDLDAMLQDYGRALPSRRRSVPAPAEAGWNSWYELWNGVDEEAVRANAHLARGILEPLLPEGEPIRIVIDDGWQLEWGDWMPNSKFPSGLDGLAADLEADGFRMGVWLAPLLVSAGLPIVTDHPDWFVDGAEFNHMVAGRMRILDVTHPDAAAHLAEFISRIVSWGYDLLKLDFLFAGAFEGERHQDVTGLEAFHRALEIIRGAAGEDVILLACGAPAVASYPHVDSWRVGFDIALEPFDVSWIFAVTQARNIAARWPLCLAVLCDPDPPLLREMEEEEVGFGTWVAAFAGGALFLSDDLRNLPADRHGLGLDPIRVHTALGAEPARPEDPYPKSPPAVLAFVISDLLSGTNNHVLPNIWVLPDGKRVGLNLTDEPLELESTTIPPHGARLCGP